MAKSALEEAVIGKLLSFRGGLAVHDRAVVFGTLCSALPLVPVAPIGLLVSLVNYALFRSGKLELDEKSWILAGIYLGLINTLLGGLLFHFLSMYLFGLDWHGAADWIANFVPDWLHRLKPWWLAKEGMRV